MKTKTPVWKDTRPYTPRADEARERQHIAALTMQRQDAANRRHLGLDKPTDLATLDASSRECLGLPPTAPKAGSTAGPWIARWKDTDPRKRKLTITGPMLPYPSDSNQAAGFAELVADVCDDRGDGEANAAHIVACVNSHAGLVAALEKIKTLAAGISEAAEGGKTFDVSEIADDVSEIADAALAAARA